MPEDQKRGGDPSVQPPEGPTHRLIVKGEDVDREYEIECPGVTGSCRLYVECDCPESKDGGDALWDDTESHGVDHRHIDGMWMKPTENCYLQWLDCMPDAASDLATRADLGPGSYPVSFDYTGEGWYELELAPTKVRHG